MKGFDVIVNTNLLNSIEVDAFKNIGPSNNANIILYKIHLSKYTELLNHDHHYLEADEINKAHRYFKPKDKNRFIICRILLKFVLAFHTKLEVTKIKLSYDQNEKPFLSSHPLLNFNVSHSEDFALIGIDHSPIGVDIEYINRDYDFMNSLEFIFNDKEVSYIKNANHKNLVFYSMWTRKEAFVKALGKGIDDDFSKIPSMGGSHHIDLLISDKPKRWTIQSLKISDEYRAAVAYEERKSSASEIVLYILPNTVKDLLKLSVL